MSTKGRAKGFKKQNMTIKDDIISPFTIIKDERQFIVMEDKNNIPCGYFVKLEYAVDFIIKQLHLKKNANKVMNLQQFINSYYEVSNQIKQGLSI